MGLDRMVERIVLPKLGIFILLVFFPPLVRYNGWYIFPPLVRYNIILLKVDPPGAMKLFSRAKSRAPTRVGDAMKGCVPPNLLSS